MPNMPLISIIVPVYNVENYLDKCVQSIVDQTYTNLEIILVDDGSPDKCGAMCDEWAKKDARIRVIHKENGGQADARNVGIQTATGEYIGFVDSDDVIAPEMYERLMSLIQEHRAHLAECCMQQFDTWPFGGFHEEETTITTYSTEEAIKNLINERVFSCTVPNILVESPIAKAVLFDTGKIHEDILWPYRVFAKCDIVVHTTARYYAYFQRPGSTMNSAYSEKRFDALDALQQRAIEVKKQFPALYPLAERVYAGSCMYHYQKLARLPKTDEYAQFQERLYRRFCDVDRKVAFQAVGMKQKLWYALFAMMPRFTCRVRNMLKIGL